MVLLVEDDPSVREGLGLALRRQGHDVRAAGTGEEGVEKLRESRPDIVVLDIMLPGIDGFETCRRMRSQAEVPIIMLTARGDDFDVVAGLEAGADDYVVKPVEPRVLEARIRAVLRRTVSEPSSVERHGSLVIDRAGLQVLKDDVKVALTPTEYRLLAAIAAEPGIVVRRRAAVAAAWPDGAIVNENTIDSYVRRLRVKLASIDSPIELATVRGVGFTLR